MFSMMNADGRPIAARVAAGRATRPRAVLLAAIAVTASVLAACSSHSTSTSAAVPVPSSSSRSGGTYGAGARGPAAYGLAAAITGDTIEVQDPATGQVSVIFSAKTLFTQSQKAVLSAIRIGDCVTAVGATATTSASASPSAPSTSFTATTLTVSPSANGTCTAGPGGGGGGFGGFGGGRASGSVRPSGAPSGGTAGNRVRIGDFATGTVTAVSGSTVTIRTIARGSQQASTDTVTTTSTTTVTRTARVTSAALKVGECVSANGTTSSSGAVTATRIALSTAGPNGCTVGFGRRPGAGASAAAGAGNA